MTRLVAHTRMAVSEPERIVASLCEHLAEHGAHIARDGDATIISLGDRRGILRGEGGELLIRAEAPDLAALDEVKETLASHAIAFAGAGRPAAVIWSGDRPGPVIPPNIRELTVESVRDITPHMRRVSFSGRDLARFEGTQAIHVRLFLPPQGASELQWPMLGENGVLRSPPDDLRPAVRKYTIREIDAQAGHLAIDFVLHEDAGPGAAWAARARAGDRIGVAGPGGRGLREADHYILLGDETALPAIGRMLAALPARARGTAMIEVADAGEVQPLVHPPGIVLRWLYREGAEPGTTSLLPDALAALPRPEPGTHLYLWAATEFAAFREIRAFVREELKLGKDEHLVVSYWRRGLSEEEHAREKAQERARIEA